MPGLIEFARDTPDRPAVILGNGDVVESYAELDRRSRQIATLMRSLGLERGHGVAVLMANDLEFFDVYWAAMRSGLYFTPINWHLQAQEIAYIVENSDASLLVASARFASVSESLSAVPQLQHRIAVHGEIPGFTPLDEALAQIEEDPPLENQLEGSVMFYSSGTTGQPKGVRLPLPDIPFASSRGSIAAAAMAQRFGFEPGDRYLSPAPLYHAAPLTFSALQHRVGATVVVMPQFDAETALATIQQQQVTSSQWVPVHFKRMLQLPIEVRERYDLSSQRLALHAAAPCPIPVKHAMIEWWGPILIEYYAGTEGGGTLINSTDWLARPGSVGRHWAGGVIHILDESGNEIKDPDVDGAVYFEGNASHVGRFRYYKDAEKTEDTYRDNLFTLGDIGHLDSDGFLFLTDRQSNMIISGGVNIYPQETENALASHPLVSDVAVIGVPNDEMGEEVKAVVIPVAEASPGSDLERELIDYCRTKIAHFKCPRSIDFAEDLPRQPTGKLYKRLIRAKYWAGRDGSLV